MLDHATILNWSPWQPLQGCWLRAKVPALPGLYRIRRQGKRSLDYLGQTSTPLRSRLANLGGIYGGLMPYRAPHTAGPALWALLDSTGCPFEVSVAVVEGADSWRKGLEALSISLHRREYGRSPTANFGRMPQGYRMSSSYNLRLKREQKLIRGEPCAETDDSHVPGIAPITALSGDPQALDWCGHAWVAWQPVTKAKLPPAVAEGLYRLRSRGQACLLYVGQGKLANRLVAHLEKCKRSGHRQGAIFGAADRLECCWVICTAWLPHHRLELENDLIAAHMLAVGDVPAGQFLGDQSNESPE